MKIIPKNEKRCIWMEGGLVSYKLCPIAYNCNDCQFDKAMRSSIAEARKVHGAGDPMKVKTKTKIDSSWVEKFRELPASQRKCRYMLQGEVSYKLCSNNFQCGSCAYDQMFQDAPLPVPDIDLHVILRVAGYIVPSDLYFHRGHSWARLEYAGRVRVGMDDFSSRIIGKVDSFQLPPLGRGIQQGEPAWQIKRDSDVVDVLSPIEGVITQVNDVHGRSLDRPYNPYADGWLFVVEPMNLRARLRSLLYGKNVKSWMEDEANRLNSLVTEEIGITLPDGGLPVDDIYRNLGEKEWGKFVRQFLLT